MLLGANDSMGNITIIIKYPFVISYYLLRQTYTSRVNIVKKDTNNRPTSSEHRHSDPLLSYEANKIAS